MKALHLTENEKRFIGGVAIGMTLAAVDSGDSATVKLAASIYEKIKAASSAKTVEYLDHSYAISKVVLPKYSEDIKEAMSDAKHEIIELAAGMNAAGKMSKKIIRK